MSGRSQRIRLRRTWPQRLLIIFNVGCIVAAVAAAGGLAYARRTTNSIDRFTLGGDFAGAQELTSTDPRNFLIVGADDASGSDADDDARRREVAGVRSDTIMIARVDPGAGDVKILSLPRDLWVEIPGHPDSRINSTLVSGGPNLLIATIKAAFDIDINHYVQIDFAGFQDLVGALDGIPIWFDAPVRDSGGLNIQNSGCTTLDRVGALQYVRARHYQVQQPNGRWKSDPLSDLSRIQRQQDFIKRVLRRAVKQGARNPVKLADFVGIGADAITLDQGTTVKDLVALGSALRDFDPETLKSYTVPVRDITRGGADVLEVKKAEAEPALALFRGTGTPEQAGSVLPSSVEVAVSNGTGKSNQGTDTTNALRLASFQTGKVLPDSSTLRTEVRYAAGQQAGAVLVARYLDGNPQLVPTDQVEVITVVTGPDFRGVLARPRPADDITLPSTTTTQATTTTTAIDRTTTTLADGETPEATVDENGVTVEPASPFVPGSPPPGTSCG